ncbi:hypothetical protein DM860_001365 [Cuscuta australis]|uniref:Uncharacterized protein n=1 Tax=Cuscuta australis TaxID=267555 RepID=A0A328E8L9_9ASTE|nr:hypothetical protein DM860_001365 [Cuscuta australis]
MISTIITYLPFVGKVQEFRALQMHFDQVLSIKDDPLIVGMRTSHAVKVKRTGAFAIYGGTPPKGSGLEERAKTSSAFSDYKLRGASLILILNRVVQHPSFGGFWYS